MRGNLLWLALLLAAPPAAAQEIHSTHCLHGCPAGAPATNDLIIREIYILNSNDQTKFAGWTATLAAVSVVRPDSRSALLKQAHIAQTQRGLQCRGS